MESKMTGNQDIMYLLRVLEDEITNSKKAVFGGGKIVDETKLLAIINDIRFNLPQALAHANAVVREREKIIRDAKSRADRMLNDAEEKANTLIDNHEIVAKAKEEADFIVANAQSYADMISNEALDSIDDMLKQSEDNFKDILNVVRNSRDDVAGMRKPVPKAPRGNAGSSMREEDFDDYNDADDKSYDYDYDNEIKFTMKD